MFANNHHIDEDRLLDQTDEEDLIMMEEHMIMIDILREFETRQNNQERFDWLLKLILLIKLR